MLNRFKRSRALAMLAAIGLSQVAMATADKWQLNMYKGVTPISKDIYYLHMVAMLICALIGVVVFGVMIYSLIHHRKSKGYQPASFHDNTRLEILWSIIPFLILIGLAIPATKVLIRMNDNDNSELTIKIVGSQWKWQYQYLDQGISYFSNLSTPYEQITNQKKKEQWYLLEVDKPLVLPVHKKVRLLVTSTDVIHSWWVPELGIKRDAIPGFIHEAWVRIDKPGIYRGQCAELCGINHAYMPIVVNVLNENDFVQWLTRQTKIKDQYADPARKSQPEKVLTRAELMTQGKNKYEQICAACHKPDGTGLLPVYPPLKGSSVAVGEPIARHISIILNGVAGSAMQAYKDQLNDDEIAAIVTYERNAWENNTNDQVQPADVAKVRNSENQQPTMIKKAQPGGLR